MFLQIAKYKWQIFNDVLSVFFLLTTIDQSNNVRRDQFYNEKHREMISISDVTDRVEWKTTWDVISRNICQMCIQT